MTESEVDTEDFYDGPDFEDEETGRVEISVKIGELYGVALTTTVLVDFTRPEEARARLRDITQTLLKAAPVEELKAMDVEYFNRFHEIGLDPKNNIVWLPRGCRDAEKLQGQIRMKLDERQRESARSAGPELPEEAKSSGVHPLPPA